GSPDHPISSVSPCLRGGFDLCFKSLAFKFSISLFRLRNLSKLMVRSFSAQGHPDHDACGTGFIVRLTGGGSHEVVERALNALKKLTHRGGVDADGSSGDGAGLLTAIPERFLRAAAAELGISLHAQFGLGMLFVRPGEEGRVRRTLEELALEWGLCIPGWREVPINASVPGSRAAETLPSVWQCFATSQVKDTCGRDALESR